MKKKLSTSELLRRACLYAEQDRLGMIDAYGNDDSEEEVRKSKAFLKQLQTYRLRRWGKTQMEVMAEEAAESADITKPGEIERLCKMFNVKEGGE